MKRAKRCREKGRKKSGRQRGQKGRVKTDQFLKLLYQFETHSKISVAVCWSAFPPVPRRIRLQDCKVTRLQGCRVTRLNGGKVARLNGCKVARSKGCKFELLQGCKVTRLQGCRAARLQGCKVAGLQSCKFPDLGFRLQTLAIYMNPKLRWQTLTSI